jgi:hypothetical protein
VADFALIFKFRDTIEDKRFKAGICVEGRVLLRQESSDDGEFWMYGVNPGGMAEHGATPEAAYGAFRQFFKGILLDMAEESANFTDFCAKVDAYMKDTCTEDAAAWEAARAARRAGQSADGVFHNSPKVLEAGEPRLVECEDLTKPTLPQPKAEAEGLLLAA